MFLSIFLQICGTSTIYYGTYDTVPIHLHVGYEKFSIEKIHFYDSIVQFLKAGGVTTFGVTIT
jgi:hypothetical protein